MQVMCANGCGYTVDVPQDVIERAMKDDATLNYCHEVCPSDLENYSTTSYQAVIVVNRKREGDRYPKRIAKVAYTAYAESFLDSLKELSYGIGNSWNKIVEMSQIVESDEA